MSSVKIYARILKESNLLFRGNFPAPDPKVGLASYGPYSATKNRIRVGIIGDKETISQTLSMFEKFRQPIEGPLRYPLWTPDFPGFSINSPFKCEFIFSEQWQQSISSGDIARLENLTFDWERISNSVDIFIKHLKNLREKEESPDVVICVPPKNIMDICIGAQKRLWQSRKGSDFSRRKKRSFDYRQRLLLEFLPDFEQAYADFLQKRAAENFHHLLKARAMNLKIPIQLILPYTLAAFHKLEEKRIQDDATVAWNLCVALLYKAETRLWRMENIQAGTCYAGISFYREKRILGGRMGVSLAQVFTPEGEGLVLKGERFDWPRGKIPHLSLESAKRLMEKVLSTYQRYTGQWPARVVVHKTSTFDDNEKKGFQLALESVPRHDFIAILQKTRRIKFFRKGKEPVLRGTVIDLTNNNWLLYTKAYIPFMRVYPGPRVPRPLEIVQHEGDTPTDGVLSEILSLSKLNWNSADFTSFLPITLQFSRQVGRILRELPPGITPETKYLYYM